jgi:hypothetical protein
MSAIVSLASPSDAGAATIQFQGWQASWDDSHQQADGSYVVLTVLAQSGSNYTVLQKVAVFGTELVNDAGDEIETIAIKFQQISADASQNLIITTESVTNATGKPWDRFAFTIVGGHETENGIPHFDLERTFSVSDPFSITPFTDVYATGLDGYALDIVVSGGIVEHGDVWRPGVASGALYIKPAPSSSPRTFQSFTFYETAIAVGGERAAIPEPASVGLLAVAGTVMLTRRQRRA